MISKNYITNKRYLVIFAVAVSIFAITTAGILNNSKASFLHGPAVHMFPSSAAIIIEMPGEMPHVMPIYFMGDTMVESLMPEDGMIPTEIVMLDLKSVAPIPIGNSMFDVVVGLNPAMPSRGEIMVDEDMMMADSFFDVFVMVDIREHPPDPQMDGNGIAVEPMSLCNFEPIHIMAPDIDHLPPTGSPYVSEIIHIPLLPCNDPNARALAFINYVYHLPGTNEDLKVEIKKEIRKLKERVSETVELSGIKVEPSEVMVLLDTTASGTLSVVHVAATLPCNGGAGPIAGPGNDTPDVKIVAGVAGGPLGDVIESIADDTGFVGPNKTCVFHDSFSPTAAVPIITDVILINAGAAGAATAKLPNGAIVTITGTYT